MLSSLARPRRWQKIRNLIPENGFPASYNSARTHNPMGISSGLAVAAALVLSSVQAPNANLVIGKFGNWVIENRPLTTTALMTRCFQIAELPNYAITQLLKFTNLPSYQLTDFAEAEAVAAQRTDPLQQAESDLQNHRYAEAETQLQSLSKTQPNNPQVWFDLGFAQSHLGKNPDAIAAYKKATELSPKWFEANLNLGLSLAKAGNFSDAATALRTAAQLKPTTGGDHALSNAWFSLARVLEESAPQESLAAYQKALEPKSNIWQRLRRTPMAP